MNALGRGLASLIPRRNKQSAQSMLEQIDSMETVGEEPANVRALRETAKQRAKAAASSDSPPAPRTTQLPVVEEAADDAVDAGEVTAEEGTSDAEEEESNADNRPVKPLVTPLSPLPPEPTAEETGDDSLFDVDPSTPEEKLRVDLSSSKIDEDEEAEVTQPTSTAVVAEPSEEREEKVIVTPKAKEEPISKDTADEASLPPAEKAKPRRTRRREAWYDDPVHHERLLGEKVEYLALGDIALNPQQPRRLFDVEEMEDLKSSLDQHGMLQPLVVIKQEDGSFQLLAGERRLRAAKELKWDEVPCVVRKGVAGERDQLELALVENIQRQNLNPVEEAMGYQQLHDEYGMTHDEIGERVGRSRVGITNIIRVLQLPAEIQRGLAEGKITLGHARAILMIPDPEKQRRFYEHVVDEGLTVRKAENRARNIQRTLKVNDPMRTKIGKRPKIALKYDGLLQEKFGYNARVKFVDDKNRFEVVFRAHSEEECKDLCELLLGVKALPEDLDKDVVEE